MKTIRDILIIVIGIILVLWLLGVARTLDSATSSPANSSLPIGAGI